MDESLSLFSYNLEINVICPATLRRLEEFLIVTDLGNELLGAVAPLGLAMSVCLWTLLKYEL